MAGSDMSPSIRVMPTTMGGVMAPHRLARYLPSCSHGARTVRTGGRHHADGPWEGLEVMGVDIQGATLSDAWRSSSTTHPASMIQLIWVMAGSSEASNRSLPIFPVVYRFSRLRCVDEQYGFALGPHGSRQVALGGAVPGIGDISSILEHLHHVTWPEQRERQEWVTAVSCGRWPLSVDAGPSTRT